MPLNPEQRTFIDNNSGKVYMAAIAKKFGIQLWEVRKYIEDKNLPKKKYGGNTSPKKPKVMEGYFDVDAYSKSYAY